MTGMSARLHAQLARAGLQFLYSCYGGAQVARGSEMPPQRGGEADLALHPGVPGGEHADNPWECG